ncbi:MAG TPA: sigma factor-like helix-turn-helix DNA-binding protein, partial [Solirubrobacteraceae bacterium]
GREHGGDPEEEALLADSVGLALMVVLDSLSPDERLAFVLHDMFAVPFDEIGAILERSPDAARQLASRGRRRIRGTDTTPEAAPGARQDVVEAFLKAARDGDFDALVAMLDPDVVRREDNGSGRLAELRGAQNVARTAMAFAKLGMDVRHARVNGGPGWVALRDGEVYAIVGLTLREGRIVAIDVLRDPARLARYAADLG